MRILIALVIVVLAGAGGLYGGFLTRPAVPAEDHDAAPVVAEPKEEVSEGNIIQLKNSFVVPVLRDGRIWSHAVLMLGVEAGQTSSEAILLREPVLRDAINEALFRHGSQGGFDGNFTDSLMLNRLRTTLNQVVRQRLSDETARVLIMAMSRQGR
ncbi:hypothetical protein JSE7799_03389 [Jannaschia seosinensis]|uniref:Flagellar basal body-associated protein FliL n=1 Tax=Jannaschia seosinensis TaxID=313367 RepID=A0A0M7BFM6_9RHOB|nr:hypothetical protein [Jannaschia seosinensis]CUH40654.1 hypothetical protein JSE7799_03389 [Jannaschia seosinensis]